MLVSSEPFISAFLNIVNSRSLGWCPSTALSIDRDFDPAENVNDLKVDSRYVIPHENPLDQRHGLIKQDGGVMMREYDQHFGVQKF